MELVKIFNNLTYPCFKLEHYFEIYEFALAKFRDKAVTLVEIGVLNGGSLEMWKTFLGPKSRIIGIDLNPKALSYSKEGIEIMIFNQESEESWDTFFEKVGDIDILIDDGGHTALGQIVTCMKSINHIKHGGLLIIEDVHSSYHKDFGTPHKFSFDNWIMRIEAKLNKDYLQTFRYPRTEIDKFSNRIRKIERYRSLIILEVQDHGDKLRGIQNKSKINPENQDFRYSSRSKIFNFLFFIQNNSLNLDAINSQLAKFVGRKIFTFHQVLMKSNLKSFLQVVLKCENRILHYTHFCKVKRYFR